MKSLRLIVSLFGFGIAFLALSGCESTSMHETPDGKNVLVEGVRDDGSPRVSPVYLTPY